MIKKTEFVRAASDVQKKRTGSIGRHKNLHKQVDTKTSINKRAILTGKKTN